MAEGILENDADKGILVYDPRMKAEVNSSNPALIFAHMVRNTGGVAVLSDEGEKEFWEGVAKLANFCDEKIIMQ